jgi:Zn-dependent protease
MTTPALRIGSLPPIHINPGSLLTILVLAVLVFPMYAGPWIPASVSVLVAVGVALFMMVSVLVHEIGHALVARAFGGTVDHIALTLWGGHTQFRAERMGHLPSLLISLAGPAGNLVLAAFATGAGALTENGTAASAFWAVSGTLNIALAVFNLLPGLPMDGGRALESLLGLLLRRPLLATRITGWIGRAIAVGVVAAPLVIILRSGGAGTGTLITLLWALLIAGMLWQGASQALRDAGMRSRVEHLTLAQLTRPVRLLHAETPLATVLGPDAPEDPAHLAQHLQDLLILSPDPTPPGAPDAARAGVGRGYRLDAEAAASVPTTQRDQVQLSAVARWLGPIGALDASLEGEQLLRVIMAQPFPAYLIRESDGAVHRLLLSDDLNQVLRGGAPRHDG